MLEIYGYMFLFFVVFCVVACIIAAMNYTPPTEAEIRQAETHAHGPLNIAMVCPHCQTKGQIRTKTITQKKGVSGGKATAAVLTAGVSMLATGLSRKEDLTEAYCGNCKSIWHF